MTIRGRSTLNAFAAAGAALALAACGSSGAASSAAPSASSGPSLRGATVKLGMISNVGVAIDQSDALGAARAAVRDINAHGGINGHPVALDFCNEGLDPNKARACARQMVGDGVIATVGNFVVTAETDVDTILRDAKIPNVGAISLTGDSGTDTNSFDFNPRYDVINIAMVHAAIASGGKNIAMLALENPEEGPWVQEITAATNGLGGRYVGTVSVPQVTGDLSTQAAALTQMKPDTVILNASASAGLQIMKDMASLGYSGRFESGSYQFLESDLQTLGVPNAITISSPFPAANATSIAAVKQYDADVSAEKAAGDHDAAPSNKIVRSPAFAAWLAAVTVQKIADQSKALTGATMLRALQSAKDVDMGGAIPAWTPNATNAAMPKPRNNATSLWAYAWTNGAVTANATAPADDSAIYRKYTTEK